MSEYSILVQKNPWFKDLVFSIWFFVYFKSGALKRPNWKHKWASKTSDWWREPKLWTVWRHRDCSQTQWTNLSCQHSNKNYDLGSIWWGKVRRGRKLIPQSEVREWEAFMWRLLITWLSMSLCHLWSISSIPPLLLCQPLPRHQSPIAFIDPL